MSIDVEYVIQDDGIQALVFDRGLKNDGHPVAIVTRRLVDGEWCPAVAGFNPVEPLNGNMDYPKLKQYEAVVTQVASIMATTFNVPIEPDRPVVLIENSRPGTNPSIGTVVSVTKTQVRVASPSGTVSAYNRVGGEARGSRYGMWGRDRIRKVDLERVTK